MTTTKRKTVFSATQGLAAASLLAALAFGTSFRFGDDYTLQLGFATAVDVPTDELDAFALVIPTIRYGLEVERYGDFEDWVLPAGAPLAQHLTDHGLGRREARRLARLAEGKLAGLTRASRQATTVRDSLGAIAYVMIEVDALTYLRIDPQAGRVTLEDADGIQSEFETMTLFYNGSVDSMLAANSFDGELANRVHAALTEEMPLDDRFEAGLVKLIYTAKRDEFGAARGYGAVEAIRYVVDGDERTAFRFADDALDVDGFFKPDGTPVTRTWLTSPVTEGWLSSPFNMRRLHPILQRVQPHYGTDYAANLGTPVLALSDGVVVARASDGNNGNFVKIEHDETYATQYLHLKGFARGLRPGKRVRKGEVIGFVGSTGLSSGPHVCLRFWKHGQQVDFQRELRRLPQTPSLSDEAMVAFAKRQAELDELLQPRA